MISSNSITLRGLTELALSQSNCTGTADNTNQDNSKYVASGPIPLKILKMCKLSG
jgi:hypothetical protein